MSTIAATNLKNASSGSNNIVLGSDGTTTLSTAKVTTLADSAGANTSTPAAIAAGIAKAWVNFSGATPTIRASYNVSSVTKNGTGQWTINFTDAFADTSYTTAFGGCSQTTSVSYYGMEQHDSQVRTTSAVKIYALNGSQTPFDAGIICVHVFR
jgi:hypothetical protein